MLWPIWFSTSHILITSIRVPIKCQHDRSSFHMHIEQICIYIAELGSVKCIQVLFCFHGPRLALLLWFRSRACWLKEVVSAQRVQYFRYHGKDIHAPIMVTWKLEKIKMWKFNSMQIKVTISLFVSTCSNIEHTINCWNSCVFVCLRYVLKNRYAL